MGNAGISIHLYTMKQMRINKGKIQSQIFRLSRFVFFPLGICRLKASGWTIQPDVCGSLSVCGVRIPRGPNESFLDWWCEISCCRSLLQFVTESQSISVAGVLPWDVAGSPLPCLPANSRRKWNASLMHRRLDLTWCEICNTSSCFIIKSA